MDTTLQHCLPASKIRQELHEALTGHVSSLAVIVSHPFHFDLEAGLLPEYRLRYVTRYIDLDHSYGRSSLIETPHLPLCWSAMTVLNEQLDSCEPVSPLYRRLTLLTFASCHTTKQGHGCSCVTRAKLPEFLK